MSEAQGPIEVEVVYALAHRALVTRLVLAPGSVVGDALLLAAQDAAFQSIDFTEATFGIYGLVVGREQTLNEGDRIEVYRPLAQDPKSARRGRARAAGRR